MICKFCKNSRFIGHQMVRTDVLVDEKGDFSDNLPGGLESHIYDSEHPYGPFTCTQCGAEYDELSEET